MHEIIDCQNHINITLFLLLQWPELSKNASTLVMWSDKVDW